MHKTRAPDKITQLNKSVSLKSQERAQLFPPLRPLKKTTLPYFQCIRQATQ